MKGRSTIGRVFLGRAKESRPKIVGANIRNRISMQPMRSGVIGVNVASLFLSFFSLFVF
jgi:hypothetical protein